MSDAIREAFEIVDRELRQNIPSGGSEVVRAWGRIKSALQQAAPAVPEGWMLVPVEPTKDMLRKSNWSGNGDVSVNEEWARRTVWDRMLAAAPQPDHSPDAGKVEPIGYLTNQAVARLQSDKRLNGEHLYAFKPDDMSKFQAVYLGPTVKDSLTAESLAQPRNEDIAADLEAWLSQVRHMEGLSAHDIVESAEIYIAQLRASQQEGG